MWVPGSESKFQLLPPKSHFISTGLRFVGFVLFCFLIFKMGKIIVLIP